ncbi:hypothetical protein ATI61_101596 [Archangium gephyra]|uniref:Lipoprotein n=1 Tax=Archangium gephyra TaxID=48 RepID=A0ABX9KBQ7_9BACT|nr:hypothetical protein [Archangium gephyra]REG37609.1 hypothetical protein ATI61_101596 [Archangium gephyra]
MRLQSQYPEFHVVALLAAVWLAGCAATDAGVRAGQTEQPEDVTSFFLVIRDARDGHAEHAWVKKAEFHGAGVADMAASTSESGACGRSRDCDQEHHECYQGCKKRKPPYPYKRNSPEHIDYCNKTCLSGYMECLKATGQHPVQFMGMNDAINWLKRHRKELLVGTVIVAAGVALVVVSSGAGVVVLAPLAAAI